MNEYVELVVGGLRYTVATADLTKHADSFFAALLKKEWKPTGDTIEIQRDGSLFKFIFAFLVNGHLPRGLDGSISLDAETLRLIKEEADFYNLPALVKECCTVAFPKDVFATIAAHGTIRNHITTVKNSLGAYGDSCPTLTCKYSSSNPADLVNVLASVWMPFCHKGKMTHIGNRKLYKSSSVSALNVPELLDAAQQSAFGKGTETVVDTTVRNSLEIQAKELDATLLATIKNKICLKTFAPKMKLDVRPYKLVIYQEGGHFEQHRDTVRGDNHIGTLVVILNSEYTGGELEISHGGKMEVVTGPYSWVAMYGDCLHKINPVTSGTRVSLIYDIYAASGAFPWLMPAAPAASSNTVNEGSDDGGSGEGAAEGTGDVQDMESDSSDWGDLTDIDPLENERIPTKTIRAMNAQQEKLIFTALGRELTRYDTVVICLAHLYPSSQANPSFLKGGDLALYELLMDKFKLAMEPVSMFITRDEEEGYTLSAAMFNDVEEQQAAKMKGRAEKSGGGEEEEEEDLPPSKKRKTDGTPPKKVKFVIPTNLDANFLLDYTPYVDYTGNESQAEESVYIVAGLQVRKL